MTNPGLLRNPGLLLPLIREVTELNQRIVVILILLAEFGRYSVSILFDPGQDSVISDIRKNTRQLLA